jgi:hypothetical protein
MIITDGSLTLVVMQFDMQINHKCTYRVCTKHYLCVQNYVYCNGEKF